MKILYMTPYIYNSGGTERVLSMKVNYLVREAGYDIIIVTTDQKGKKNFFDFDSCVKHYDLGLNYIDDFSKNIISRAIAHYKKNRRYKKLLKEIIIKENPDVCMSLFGKEIEFLGNMSIDCKKAAELHFNLHFRHDMLMTAHKGRLWKLIGIWRTHQLIKETQRLDKIVVLTIEDLQQWKKTNNNVCQIYNPLPYESLEVSSLTTKNIISIGRLSPQKNYISLIRAWKIVNAKHPTWHLNILGEGELKEQLHEEIRRYDLESTFHLCGRIEHVNQEYLRSCAFVMSSSFEGFPMVLLEAASFGLPLISYDCYCGPKDIIENGKNGVLVKLNDEQALADAICQVIENEAFRKEMGHLAKISSQRFSQKNILPQWPIFFEKLVNVSR